MGSGSQGKEGEMRVALATILCVVIYAVICPLQFIAIWIHYDLKEAYNSVKWNWRELLKSR